MINIFFLLKVVFHFEELYVTSQRRTCEKNGPSLVGYLHTDGN